MAITVLGGEPATRAMAAAAIARSRPMMPKLAGGGRDIVVVTADSRGYDPVSDLPGSGLVVMTDRPSVVQAAAALLMGADAYLPSISAHHERPRPSTGSCADKHISNRRQLRRSVRS